MRLTTCLASGNACIAATAAGQFPAMIYRSNSLSLTLSFPINDRVGVKLFNTYEQARISDWHYLGFDGRKIRRSSTKCEPPRA